MLNLNELNELIKYHRKTLMFLEDYRSSVIGVHYMTNANTAEDIMFRSIETVSGITKEKLLVKTRKAEFVLSRSLGMNILLRKVQFGLSKAGATFFKDHTTAYHAKKAYNNWLDTKDVAIVRYKQVSDVFDDIVEILKDTIKNTENG